MLFFHVIDFLDGARRQIHPPQSYSLTRTLAASPYTPHTQPPTHRSRCKFRTGQEFLFIVYDTYVSLSLCQTNCTNRERFSSEERNLFSRILNLLLSHSLQVSEKFSVCDYKWLEQVSKNQQYDNLVHWMWQIKAQLNKLHCELKHTLRMDTVFGTVSIRLWLPTEWFNMYTSFCNAYTWNWSGCNCWN